MNWFKRNKNKLDQQEKDVILYLLTKERDRIKKLYLKYNTNKSYERYSKLNTLIEKVCSL